MTKKIIIAGLLAAFVAGCNTTEGGFKAPVSAKEANANVSKSIKDINKSAKGFLKIWDDNARNDFINDTVQGALNRHQHFTQTLKATGGCRNNYGSLHHPSGKYAGQCTVYVHIDKVYEKNGKPYRDITVDSRQIDTARLYERRTYTKVGSVWKRVK